MYNHENLYDISPILHIHQEETTDRKRRQQQSIDITVITTAISQYHHYKNIKYHFTAAVTVNHYINIRCISIDNNSGVPISKPCIRVFPWFRDDLKRIIAMDFSPDCDWLICLCMNLCIYMIPIKAYFHTSQQAYLHPTNLIQHGASTSSLTNDKILPSLATMSSINCKRPATTIQSSPPMSVPVVSSPLQWSSPVLPHYRAVSPLIIRQSPASSSVTAATTNNNNNTKTTTTTIRRKPLDLRCIPLHSNSQNNNNNNVEDTNSQSSIQQPHPQTIAPMCIWWSTFDGKDDYVIVVSVDGVLTFINLFTLESYSYHIEMEILSIELMIHYGMYRSQDEMTDKMANKRFKFYSSECENVSLNDSMMIGGNDLNQWKALLIRGINGSVYKMIIEYRKHPQQRATITTPIPPTTETSSLWPFGITQAATMADTSSSSSVSTPTIQPETNDDIRIRYLKHLPEYVNIVKQQHQLQHDTTFRPKVVVQEHPDCRISIQYILNDAIIGIYDPLQATFSVCSPSITTSDGYLKQYSNHLYRIKDGKTHWFTENFIFVHLNTCIHIVSTNLARIHDVNDIMYSSNNGINRRRKQVPFTSLPKPSQDIRLEIAIVQRLNLPNNEKCRFLSSFQCNMHPSYISNNNNEEEDEVMITSARARYPALSVPLDHWLQQTLNHTCCNTLMLWNTRSVLLCQIKPKHIEYHYNHISNMIRTIIQNDNKSIIKELVTLSSIFGCNQSILFAGAGDMAFRSQNYARAFHLYEKAQVSCEFLLDIAWRSNRQHLFHKLLVGKELLKPQPLLSSYLQEDRMKFVSSTSSSPMHNNNNNNNHPRSANRIYIRTNNQSPLVMFSATPPLVNIASSPSSSSPPIISNSRDHIVEQQQQQEQQQLNHQPPFIAVNNELRSPKLHSNNNTNNSNNAELLTKFYIQCFVSWISRLRTIVCYHQRVYYMDKKTTPSLRFCDIMKQYRSNTLNDTITQHDHSDIILTCNNMYEELIKYLRNDQRYNTEDLMEYFISYRGHIASSLNKQGLPCLLFNKNDVDNMDEASIWCLLHIAHEHRKMDFAFELLVSHGYFILDPNQIGFLCVRDYNSLLLESRSGSQIFRCLEPWLQLEIIIVEMNATLQPVDISGGYNSSHVLEVRRKQRCRIFIHSIMKLLPKLKIYALLRLAIFISPLLSYSKNNNGIMTENDISSKEIVELYLCCLLRLLCLRNFHKHMKRTIHDDDDDDRFNQECLENDLRQYSSRYRCRLMIQQCFSNYNYVAAAVIHEAMNEWMDGFECRLLNVERQVLCHEEEQQHTTNMIMLISTHLSKLAETNVIHALIKLFRVWSKYHTDRMHDKLLEVALLSQTNDDIIGASLIAIVELSSENELCIQFSNKFYLRALAFRANFLRRLPWWNPSSPSRRTRGGGGGVGGGNMFSGINDERLKSDIINKLNNRLPQSIRMMTTMASEPDQEIGVVNAAARSYTTLKSLTLAKSVKPISLNNGSSPILNRKRSVPTTRIISQTPKSSSYHHRTTSTMLSSTSLLSTLNHASPRNIIAFSCGHSYSRSYFREHILPEFALKMSLLPFCRVPITTKILLRHYEEAKHLQLACPICVQILIFQIQTKKNEEHAQEQARIRMRMREYQLKNQTNEAILLLNDDNEK